VARRDGNVHVSVGHKPSLTVSASQVCR
jgi:hypothetical protein